MYSNSHWQMFLEKSFSQILQPYLITNNWYLITLRKFSKNTCTMEFILGKIVGLWPATSEKVKSNTSKSVSGTLETSKMRLFVTLVNSLFNCQLICKELYFRCCWGPRYSNWDWTYFSKIFNPLVPVGNKRPYILKKTCSLQLQVCFNIYDLLLLPSIKGLTF